MDGTTSYLSMKQYLKYYSQPIQTVFTGLHLPLLKLQETILLVTSINGLFMAQKEI